MIGTGHFRGRTDELSHPVRRKLQQSLVEAFQAEVL
jgi:hypothetical protein